MKLLGPRLGHLSSLYNNENEVWDIGCDHGLLGLFFLNHPLVNRINLVDPSPFVIKALETNLKDSYITIPEKIRVIKEKGQKLNINNDQKKIIFMAGMGGKETRDILIHLVSQLNEDDVVIISPHKNILEVRAYLESSNYRLINEKIVQENQRFYQILALTLTSNIGRVSPYGKEIWQSPLAQSYRSYILRTYKSHQDELSKKFVAYLEGLSC